MKVTISYQRGCGTKIFIARECYLNICWLWKEDTPSRAQFHHSVHPLVLGYLHCAVTALTVLNPYSLSAFHDLWLLCRQHKREAWLTSNMGKGGEAAIPLPLFKLHKSSQGSHIERNHMSQMDSCKSSHIRAIENVRCNSSPYSNPMIFQTLPSSRAGSRIHACCWLFLNIPDKLQPFGHASFPQNPKKSDWNLRPTPTLSLETAESFQSIRKLCILAKFPFSPACLIFMAVRNPLQSFWLHLMTTCIYLA